MLALSIVSPNGMNIAAGRKAIEVRSWRPSGLPLRNLLIVENAHRLGEENPADPDGWAVAIVDVEEVHEWQPAEVEAACATTWQLGYWAWSLTNIRPLTARFQVPAKRQVYEADIQLRTAAVILNQDAVLLQQREGDAFWALPGGRIERGETAVDALIREMREELAESVECERLLWAVENTYCQNGAQIDEIGFYYLVTLSPDSTINRVGASFAGREEQANLIFSWFDRPQLAQLDVRPSFVAQALSAADF